MADVFISYSRANIDFARRLASELRATNYDLWIDLEGIRFNADWWDEIKRGIEQCNNFVVVMSPNSLGSPVCHLEIEYARKLSKRIILLSHIPFERKEVSRAMLDRLASDAYVNTLLGDRNPMTLFDNNWYVIEKYQRVNFPYDAGNSAQRLADEPETDSQPAEESAFSQHFADLRQALETDLDHVNFHTRMGLRTRDWQRSGSNESFLLFGDELAQAERWLTDYDADSQTRERNNGSPKLPKPTDDQRAYIHASRKVEAARAQRLRNIRRAGIGAGLAAIIALIFAAIASVVGVNNFNNANATLTPIAQQVRDSQALNESLRLAAQANTILQDQYSDKLSAVLLGIRALKEFYSPQADAVLFQARDNNYQKMGLVGHTAYVSSVAFAPDGRTALTGSWDGSAILWNVETGQVLRTLSGHNDFVTSVAFSPDGRTALTGSYDKTAILWDIETGQALRTLSGHTSSIYSVAFAPDGRTALTGSWDGSAILWNVETGQVLRTLSGHAATVNSVAFAPDGRTVLTGSYDKTAILWDVETGQALRTLNSHTSSISSVAFAPDGRTALTGSDDKTAILWDVETGQALRTLNGHTSSISSVAFAPDGRTVLTGSWDKTAILWDVGTGKALHILTGRSNAVTSVAFSPDGRTVLTGSYDKTVILWDIEMDQSLHTLNGHTATINSVAFSPDGRTALTGSDDKTAILWDVGMGRILRILSNHKDAVTSAAFAPDGRTVVTGSWDKSAILWDVGTGQSLRTLRSHSDVVTSVAFALDGRTVVTGSWDNTAILWDVGTGQSLRTLNGHTNAVTSVAFAPDGRTVVTGSWDKTAILWDMGTGQSLRTLNGHTNAVTSVAFAPDGRTALTGSDDKTAILWDVGTGQALRTLSGQKNFITSFAFSPYGRKILTGSSDSTVRILDMDYNDFIIDSCTHVWRDFTEFERQQFVIADHEPTCFQFATKDNPATIFIPTSTLLAVTLPVWTPIISPTPSATEKLAASGTPSATSTHPGILLTFTSTPTSSITPTVPTSTPSITPTLPTSTPTEINYPVTQTADAALALATAFIEQTKTQFVALMTATVVTFTPSPTVSAIHIASVSQQHSEIPMTGGEIWMYSGNAGENLTIRVNADKPANNTFDRIGLLDTYFTLRAPDGTTLQEVDDIDPGIVTNSLLENYTLPVNGVYQIEVRGWNNSTGGGYTLIIESSKSQTQTPDPSPSFTPSLTLIATPPP